MATILGRQALDRKFRQMPDEVRRAVDRAVREGADELVGMQKRMAPQGGTGDLQASIRAELANDQQIYRATVMAGGTAATRRVVERSGEVFDVAQLVEFGTHAHRASGKFKGALIPSIPARPFFFPAYRALRKRIKSRISRAMTAAIKKVCGSGHEQS